MKTRTLLKLSVFATLRSFYKRSSSAPNFEFREARTAITPSLFVTEPVEPKREQRNPVVLAEEWQQRITSGEVSSRAELARALGVSRARVTQVLGLLQLAPSVIDTVRSLGDPLVSSAVGERALRLLVALPPSEQWQATEGLLRGWMGGIRGD